MSENDVTVPVDNLYTENRKIVDEEADRYFFVADPVEITVEGVPEDLEPEIRLHPEDPGRGVRSPEIDVQDGELRLLIDRKDLEEGFLRLKALCNIEITDAENGRAEFREGDHHDAMDRDADIIHWVPEDAELARVVMPDAEEIEGRIEPNSIEGEEVVQFERFGFARCDEPEENIFYYAHR